MRAVLITIFVLALVVIGGGAIATTAYQAGLQTAVIAEGGAVVTPVIVQGAGWGWGWGPGFGGGFGFLGFFGFLLVLFLVIGLIRAIAGPRHRHGHGSWESRAHDRFETWHRESHGTDTLPPATPPAAG